MQTVGMERLGSVVARIAARLVRHEEFRDPASSTRSAGQIGGEAPRRGSTSPCGGGRAEAGDAVGPPQPGGSAEEARCEIKDAVWVWAARESTRNSVPRHASTPFSTRSPRTELICCAHDPST